MLILLVVLLARSVELVSAVSCSSPPSGVLCPHEETDPGEIRRAPTQMSCLPSGTFHESCSIIPGWLQRDPKVIGSFAEEDEDGSVKITSRPFMSLVESSSWLELKSKFGKRVNKGFDALKPVKGMKLAEDMVPFGQVFPSSREEWNQYLPSDLKEWSGQILGPNVNRIRYHMIITKSWKLLATARGKGLGGLYALKFSGKKKHPNKEKEVELALSCFQHLLQSAHEIGPVISFRFIPPWPIVYEPELVPGGLPILPSSIRPSSWLFSVDGWISTFTGWALRYGIITSSGPLYPNTRLVHTGDEGSFSPVNMAAQLCGDIRWKLKKGSADCPWVIKSRKGSGISPQDHDHKIDKLYELELYHEQRKSLPDRIGSVVFFIEEQTLYLLRVYLRPEMSHANHGHGALSALIGAVFKKAKENKKDIRVVLTPVFPEAEGVHITRQELRGFLQFRRFSLVSTVSVHDDTKSVRPLLPAAAWTDVSEEDAEEARVAAAEVERNVNIKGHADVYVRKHGVSEEVTVTKRRGFCKLLSLPCTRASRYTTGAPSSNEEVTAELGTISQPAETSEKVSGADKSLRKTAEVHPHSFGIGGALSTASGIAPPCGHTAPVVEDDEALRHLEFGEAPSAFEDTSEDKDSLGGRSDRSIPEEERISPSFTNIC